MARAAPLLALLALLALSAAPAMGEMTQSERVAEKQAKYLKRTGQKFLDEVAAKDGATKLPSGMVFEVMKRGTEPKRKSPNLSDPCEVTYAGTLKDGTPFDSGTTSFAPNQVIKGWTEALQYMSEGDKWKLYIPYDMAYGERGSGAKIGPYAPLVFEVEIHEVKSGGKSWEEAKERLDEELKKSE